MTTRRLEAHYLAGGNVPNVIRAIIAAHRADIHLDFDRAAAIDLAGRDVLDAVQTSVYPKVIDCPDPTLGPHHPRRHRQERRRAEGPRQGHGADQHRAVDRRGHRGDDHRPGGRGHHHGHRLLDQPLAGDGEPRSISKAVLNRGLDAQTAFEIVSIDIADIDVGENIGARLQADQAEADTRVARAKAEERRALATRGSRR